MNIRNNLGVLTVALASIAGFSACNDTKDLLGKPIVSDISPNGGSENGGTLVTITGENFDENVTIEIGGADCNFETLTSDNEISCLTGEKAVGEDTAYDVVVTNPDGDSDTLSDAYTYENE
jgi:hypothetical protein